MQKDIQIEQDSPSSAPAPQKPSGRFTRQPLSSLGKFAARSYLFLTIAGSAGAIVLAVFAGGPSRDVVLLTISSLLITVLLFSGLRWLQVLAALIGCYNLYLIFTEPYVIDSLGDPKGPNGGYGHFVGDVLVGALALLAFTACVGMLIHNFRSDAPQPKYPSWFNLFRSGALGLIVGACFIGALAQPPTNNQLTYTNGVPTVHMGPGTFAISAVTISKGSKLLLVDDTSALHILANGLWQQGAAVIAQEPGAPIVHNLSFTGNSQTIGPFVTAGTYHILCLVHKDMNLTITVQ